MPDRTTTSDLTKRRFARYVFRHTLNPRDNPLTAHTITEVGTPVAPPGATGRPPVLQRRRCSVTVPAASAMATASFPQSPSHAIPIMQPTAHPQPAEVRASLPKALTAPRAACFRPLRARGPLHARPSTGRAHRLECGDPCGDQGGDQGGDQDTGTTFSSAAFSSTRVPLGCRPLEAVMEAAFLAGR